MVDMNIILIGGSKKEVDEYGIYEVMQKIEQRTK